MCELVVAQELKMTLNELRERMVPEELYLWVAFLELRRDKEAEAMKKAQRRRR